MTYWTLGLMMTTTTNGELEAVKSEHGWRWVFYSHNGATHLGGRWFRSKKEALAAGHTWVKDRHS